MAFEFTDEVARGVLGHMNADHSDDAVEIVRTLTSASDASAAEAVGIGPEGMRFRVTTPAGEAEHVIAWGREIRERPDIRAAVVDWYTEAIDR